MNTRTLVLAVIFLIVCSTYAQIPSWLQVMRTPWSQSVGDKKIGCRNKSGSYAGAIDCISTFLQDQMNMKGTPEFSLAQTFRIGWDYVFPSSMPAQDVTAAYTLGSRADVHDNALAAMVLMLNGKMDEARTICDTFVLMVNLDSNADGRTRTAYYANSPVQRDYDGSTILTYGANAIDQTVVTGNMAYQILALGRFYLHTHDYKYLQAAIKIATFIKNNLSVNTAWSGFSDGYDVNGTFVSSRSTEGNAAVFAAARLLYGITGDAKWSQMMTSASVFVSNMYTSDQGFYYTGTADSSDKWKTTFPTSSAQVWTLLSGADSTSTDRNTNALNWVLNNLQITEYQTDDITGNTIQYSGVLFSTGGSGLSSEQTASAALALSSQSYTILGKDKNSAVFKAASEKFLTTLINMQTYALRGDGHGIVAAVNPSGSVTWPSSAANDNTVYQPVLHVASSAWAALALYYIRSGNDFANPYADYSKQSITLYTPNMAVSKSKTADLTTNYDYTIEYTFSIGASTISLTMIIGFFVLIGFIVLSVLNIKLYLKNKEVVKENAQEMEYFTRLQSPGTPTVAVTPTLADAPRANPLWPREE